MKRIITEIRRGLIHGPVNSYVTSKNLTSLNPFVLWDHFYLPQSDQPAGFGFHGHSGVATITYPIQGDIEHQDTGGHEGKLLAGGIQVMSSGKGVLHKEIILPDQKVANAFQLWTALPTYKQEMGDVTYSTCDVSQLPITEIEGVKVKTIIGGYQNEKSPIIAPVEMTYLQVQLENASTWQFKAPSKQTTAFIYILSGKVSSGDIQLLQEEMGIFETSEEIIEINSLSENVNFLVVTGKPLNQEIISNGSSIHSSSENLLTGISNIRKLQNKM